MKKIILISISVFALNILSADYLFKYRDKSGALPDSLVVSDSTGVFYYGTVGSNFITGSQLASTIGLTAGTVSNDTAGWLKFDMDGKTLFVAKKPFRYNLTWDQINAKGAIFGTATITINNVNYKVRSLTTNEWNRLIYRVSSVIPPNQNGDNLANYTNTELGLGNNTGGATWTQSPYSSYGKTMRGQLDITTTTWAYSNDSYYYVGWRPVLEKM